MEDIVDSIGEAISDFFKDAVEYGLNGMFATINYSVSEAASELSQDPTSWNNGILSLVRSVSVNAIVPVAVIILTLVVCYDFISSLLDKSTRDIEPEVILKFGFKACIGVFLLNHTFDFTLGVFQMGQFVVDKAISTFGDSSEITVDLYNVYKSQIDGMNVGELIIALIEIGFINILSLVVSIAVIAVTSARMIEIYIFCSAAPIPFATLTNKEWGSIGTNYIRNIFALAFQAFFMMICVGIYSALVNNVVISSTDSLMYSLAKCFALGVILIMTLFKCGTISKSIFNAL